MVKEMGGSKFLDFYKKIQKQDIEDEPFYNSDFISFS
jgi:hypothetical protein